MICLRTEPAFRHPISGAGANRLLLSAGKFTYIAGETTGCNGKSHKIVVFSLRRDFSPDGLKCK